MPNTTSGAVGGASGPFSPFCLLFLLALAACSVSQPRRRLEYAPPTSVSMAVTMAEPAMALDLEIEHLRRWHTIPALLRRSWLELQRGRAPVALEAASEALYGLDRPSAHEEAFARYLRAEAYVAQGQGDRGEFDRQRAAELALDPDLQRALRANAPVAVAAPEAAPARVDLTLYDRANWSARTPVQKQLDPMGAVYRLTIHHSAMPFRDQRPAVCAAQIQQIQREHMQSRGYGDIGYHYLIDPVGRVWQGRDLRWQGAHASGDNNVGNLGICLLGNFLKGKTGQAPTQQQVAAMGRLVTSLMRRYRIDADQVFCHSDFKATQCPGPLLEPAVEKLRRDLRQHGSASNLAAADVATWL
jgi:hypothetical protein